MKTYSKTLRYKAIGTAAIAVVSVLGVAGCSSAPQNRNEQRQAQAAPGPAVLNPRAATPVLMANANLNEAKVPNVMADVKSSEPGVGIKSVQLRLVLDPNSLKNDFTSAEMLDRKPIDIPMQHVAGTTWGVNINDKDMKALAINGEDLKYIGRVIAKSDNGGVTVSDDVVRLEVRAPAAVEKSS